MDRCIAFGVLGALLLAACADPQRISRDDFPSMAAGAFCDRLKECARGEFDRAYFGKRDCVAHMEVAFRETDEFFDNLGCDYDEEGAARAWQKLQGMSCEDFYEDEYLEDYDKVWDC